MVNKLYVCFAKSLRKGAAVLISASLVLYSVVPAYAYPYDQTQNSQSNSQSMSFEEMQMQMMLQEQEAQRQAQMRSQQALQNVPGFNHPLSTVTVTRSNNPNVIPGTYRGGQFLYSGQYRPRIVQAQVLLSNDGRNFEAAQNFVATTRDVQVRLMLQEPARGALAAAAYGVNTPGQSGYDQEMIDPSNVMGGGNYFSFEINLSGNEGPKNIQIMMEFFDGARVGEQFRISLDIEDDAADQAAQDAQVTEAYNNAIAHLDDQIQAIDDHIALLEDLLDQDTDKLDEANELYGEAEDIIAEMELVYDENPYPGVLGKVNAAKTSLENFDSTSRHINNGDTRGNYTIWRNTQQNVLARLRTDRADAVAKKSSLDSVFNSFQNPPNQQVKEVFRRAVQDQAADAMLFQSQLTDPHRYRPNADQILAYMHRIKDQVLRFQSELDEMVGDGLDYEDPVIELDREVLPNGQLGDHLFPDWSHVDGTIEVTGEVFDNKGLESLEFKVIDVHGRVPPTVLASLPAAGQTLQNGRFTLTIDTTQVRNSTYDIQIIARDKKGNETIINKKFYINNPDITAPTMRVGIINDGQSFNDVYIDQYLLEDGAELSGHKRLIVKTEDIGGLDKLYVDLRNSAGELIDGPSVYSRFGNYYRYNINHSGGRTHDLQNISFPTDELPPGEYTLTFRVTDAANPANETIQEFNITVVNDDYVPNPLDSDVEAPTFTIGGGLNHQTATKVYDGDVFPITVTDDVGLDSVKVVLKAGPPANNVFDLHTKEYGEDEWVTADALTFVYGQGHPSYPDGTYLLEVIVLDKAGKETKNHYVVRVDNANAVTPLSAFLDEYNDFKTEVLDQIGPIADHSQSVSRNDLMVALEASSLPDSEKENWEEKYDFVEFLIQFAKSMRDGDDLPEPPNGMSWDEARSYLNSLGPQNFPKDAADLLSAIEPLLQNGDMTAILSVTGDDYETTLSNASHASGIYSRQIKATLNAMNDSLSAFYDDLLADIEAQAIQEALDVINAEAAEIYEDTEEAVNNYILGLQELMSETNLMYGEIGQRTQVIEGIRSLMDELVTLDNEHPEVDLSNLIEANNVILAAYGHPLPENALENFNAFGEQMQEMFEEINDAVQRNQLALGNLGSDLQALMRETDPERHEVLYQEFILAAGELPLSDSIDQPSDVNQGNVVELTHVYNQVFANYELALALISEETTTNEPEVPDPVYEITTIAEGDELSGLVAIGGILQDDPNLREIKVVIVVDGEIVYQEHAMYPQGVEAEAFSLPEFDSTSFAYDEAHVELYTRSGQNDWLIDGDGFYVTLVNEELGELPVVEITSPSPNQTVSGRTVTITGTVQDDDMDLKEVILTRTNGTVTQVITTINLEDGVESDTFSYDWNVENPRVDGAWTIIANVIDQDGNQGATVEVPFMIDNPIDTTLPLIGGIVLDSEVRQVRLDPTTSVFARYGEITISGSGFDETEIAGGRIELQRGNQHFTVYNGLFPEGHRSYQFSGVIDTVAENVPNGEWTVFMEVMDRAGNRQSRTVNMTIHNEPPETAVINLTSPVQGAYASDELRISGTVNSQDSGFVLDFFLRDANGTEHQLGSMAKGLGDSFSYTADIGRLGIPNGEYTVVVKHVKDGGANGTREYDAIHDEIQITVDEDNVNPTITIDTPPRGTVLDSPVQVTGTVTDSHGIDKVRFKVRQCRYGPSGVAMGCSHSLYVYDESMRGQTEGTYSFNLNPNQYTMSDTLLVSVVVFDLAGNETETYRTYRLHDRNAPTLNITSQIHDINTGRVYDLLDYHWQPNESGSIRINGNASDDVGLDRVVINAVDAQGNILKELKNMDNNYLQNPPITSLDAGEFSERIFGRDVPTDTYRITITAYDRGGNSTQRSFRVTRRDTEAPELQTVQYGLWADMVGPTEVKVSVFDESGIKNNRIKVSIRNANGQSVYNDTINVPVSEFRQTVSHVIDSTLIPDGQNYTIVFEAEDNEGNVRTLEKAIRVFNNSSPDGVPPVIANFQITMDGEVVDDGDTVSDVIRFSGAISDDVELGNATIVLRNVTANTTTVLLNESFANEARTTFTFNRPFGTVSKSDGSYEMVLTVRDKEGNVSEATRTFVIDNTPVIVDPPVVNPVITGIQKNLNWANRTIEFSGTLRDYDPTKHKFTVKLNNGRASTVSVTPRGGGIYEFDLVTSMPGNGQHTYVFQIFDRQETVLIDENALHQAAVGVFIDDSVDPTRPRISFTRDLESEPQRGLIDLSTRVTAPGSRIARVTYTVKDADGRTVHSAFHSPNSTFNGGGQTAFIQELWDSGSDNSNRIEGQYTVIVTAITMDGKRHTEERNIEIIYNYKPTLVDPRVTGDDAFTGLRGLQIGEGHEYTFHYGVREEDGEDHSNLTYELFVKARGVVVTHPPVGVFEEVWIPVENGKGIGVVNVLEFKETTLVADGFNVTEEYKVVVTDQHGSSSEYKFEPVHEFALTTEPRLSLETSSMQENSGFVVIDVDNLIFDMSDDTKRFLGIPRISGNVPLTTDVFVDILDMNGNVVIEGIEPRSPANPQTANGGVRFEFDGLDAGTTYKVQARTETRLVGTGQFPNPVDGYLVQTTSRIFNSTIQTTGTGTGNNNNPNDPNNPNNPNDPNNPNNPNDPNNPNPSGNAPTLSNLQISDETTTSAIVSVNIDDALGESGVVIVRVNNRDYTESFSGNGTVSIKIDGLEPDNEYPIQAVRTESQAGSSEMQLLGNEVIETEPLNDPITNRVVFLDAIADANSVRIRLDAQLLDRTSAFMSLRFPLTGTYGSRTISQRQFIEIEIGGLIPGTEYLVSEVLGGTVRFSDGSTAELDFGEARFSTDAGEFPEPMELTLPNVRNRQEVITRTVIGAAPGSLGAAKSLFSSERGSVFVNIDGVDEYLGIGDKLVARVQLIYNAGHSGNIKAVLEDSVTVTRNGRYEFQFDGLQSAWMDWNEGKPLRLAVEVFPANEFGRPIQFSGLAASRIRQFGNFTIIPSRQVAGSANPATPVPVQNEVNFRHFGNFVEALPDTRENNNRGGVVVMEVVDRVNPSKVYGSVDSSFSAGDEFAQGLLVPQYVYDNGNETSPQMDLRFTFYYDDGTATVQTVRSERTQSGEALQYQVIYWDRGPDGVLRSVPGGGQGTVIEGYDSALMDIYQRRSGEFVRTGTPQQTVPEKFADILRDKDDGSENDDPSISTFFPAGLREEVDPLHSRLIDLNPNGLLEKNYIVWSSLDPNSLVRFPVLYIGPHVFKLKHVFLNDSHLPWDEGDDEMDEDFEDEFEDEFEDDFEDEGFEDEIDEGMGGIMGPGGGEQPGGGQGPDEGGDKPCEGPRCFGSEGSGDRGLSEESGMSGYSGYQGDYGTHYQMSGSMYTQSMTYQQTLQEAYRQASMRQQAQYQSQQTMSNVMMQSSQRSRYHQSSMHTMNSFHDQGYSMYEMSMGGGNQIYYGNSTMSSQNRAEMIRHCQRYPSDPVCYDIR